MFQGIYKINRTVKIICQDHVFELTNHMTYKLFTALTLFAELLF